jgi:hypothetical protein
VPLPPDGGVIMRNSVPTPWHTANSSHTGSTIGGYTITVVLDVEEHPPAVTVTVYVPALAVVTFVIDGVLEVDVKPPGPDHE